MNTTGYAQIEDKIINAIHNHMDEEEIVCTLCNHSTITRKRDCPDIIVLQDEDFDLFLSDIYKYRPDVELDKGIKKMHFNYLGKSILVLSKSSSGILEIE